METSKKKMSERGWKGIHKIVEITTNSEMKKRGGKMIYRMFEII